MPDNRVPAWVNSAGIKALDTIWRLGARKAAEDLTVMAGEDFFLADVRFRKLPLTELSCLLGEPDERISTVLLEIRGDCRGEVLLLMPQSSCNELVNILFSGSEFSPEELETLHREALGETGNILGSAFLNSIALLTGLEVLPTVPGIAEDMIGAIMDIIQIKYASRGDHIFVAKSGLVRGKEPLDLFLLAILEEESLASIVDAFEKKSGTKV